MATNLAETQGVSNARQVTASSAAANGNTLAAFLGSPTGNEKRAVTYLFCYLRAQNVRADRLAVIGAGA